MHELTHLDARGQAHMVDVGQKEITSRTAVASAAIRMQVQTLERIIAGEHPKGDVLATARIAGIMAAKKTADLIPLCHPLMLSKVAVELTPDTTLPGIRIESTCRLAGRTGVEMEALTAASVAALTLYDMCKAVDKRMVIEDIKVLEKTGGKSGDWRPFDDQTQESVTLSSSQPASTSAPQASAKVQVRFFAELREQLQMEACEVRLEDLSEPTVAALLNWLVAQASGRAEVLYQPQLLMAVNQDMAKATQVLQPGDEVAFFPPVTGG